MSTHQATKYRHKQISDYYFILFPHKRKQFIATFYVCTHASNILLRSRFACCVWKQIYITQFHKQVILNAFVIAKLMMGGNMLSRSWRTYPCSHYDLVYIGLKKQPDSAFGSAINSICGWLHREHQSIRLIFGSRTEQGKCVFLFKVDQKWTHCTTLIIHIEFSIDKVAFYMQRL